MNKKIAVVVGFHKFPVIEFYDFFQNIPGYQFYIQHLEQFTSSSRETRESYDAIVFYIFRQDSPSNEAPGYCGKELDAFEDLGKKEQGLLILHHSILAFPDYPLWQEITKIDAHSFTDYAHDQNMAIQVVNPDHPLMKQIHDFEIIDEVYLMASPDDSVTPLLLCSNKNSMPVIAWTHTFKNAKVYCLELGHDEQAWENPIFEQLLVNGLEYIS